LNKELYRYTSKGKAESRPTELQIDVIREFLIPQAFQMPSISCRRVFIVQEADKMNLEAQNATLKVLEEPPTYCCIVLICARPDRLLPTIRSRSHLIRFSPLDHGIIQKHLCNAGIQGDLARFLAFISGGSLGRARILACLEGAGGLLTDSREILITGLTNSDTIVQVERIVAQCDAIAKAWSSLEPQTSPADLRRRSHRLLIDILLSILQDALKLDLLPPDRLANLDRTEPVKAMARSMDKDAIINAIEQAYEASRMLESAVNERLVWERLLLELGCRVNINRFGG
jgi:DNA polymerase III gamma/tau subunit